MSDQRRPEDVITSALETLAARVFHEKPTGETALWVKSIGDPALAALDHILQERDEWHELVHAKDKEINRLHHIEEAVIEFRDGGGGPTRWAKVLAALDGS